MSRALTTGPAWAVLLALAACDASTGRPPTPAEPAQKAAPVVPNRTAGGPQWRMDPQSTALAYGIAAEPPVVTLTCSDSAELQVTVASFRKIASEDRLTLGAGDEAFAFAADLTSTAPGVVAGGPMTPDLVDRIERGQSISAAYGVQRLAPVPGPPRALSGVFAAACRSRIRPS